jgi:hypothetical protein
MLRTDPIIATGQLFFKRRLLHALLRFIRAETAARHGMNEKQPQAIRTWLAAVCAYYLLCCQKANYFSASQAVRASRIAALSLSVTEQGCDPTGSHLFL